ncbi:MAG: hypothetical protein PF569_10355 [Candidatus Woesearchaeota archaeon]|jgi:hypothetical protein|nr:hypothetical protein [Candidatus Woesearchaeota archaeon]
MKYNIRINDDEKKAIFDETGKQISDWWYVVYPDGLVNEQSDFYIVLNDNDQEAIFHKSGIQISEWWVYIYTLGLISGTSNEYIVDTKINKYKTLTFDRTKFIMNQIKEKLK